MNTATATLKLLGVVVLVYAVSYGCGLSLTDDSESWVTTLLIALILALFPLGILVVPYARSLYTRHYECSAPDPSRASHLVLHRDPFGIAVTLVIALFASTLIAFPILNYHFWGNTDGLWLTTLGAAVMFCTLALITPVMRTESTIHGHLPHVSIRARSGTFFGLDGQFDQLSAIAAHDP